MIVPILIIALLGMVSRLSQAAVPQVVSQPLPLTRNDGPLQYGRMVPVPTVQPQFTAAASINPQNTFAPAVYEGAVAGFVSGMWA